VYQLAALAGFGQLLVSREFMAFFGDYMRFWYSLLYLIVALGNIVAVNVYLGLMKKLMNYAKVFMFTVTFPALSLAAFFLSNYAEIAVHPLVMVPQMSGEATFIAIVAFDTFVVGLGTYVFFKPKWWYIALGAGTAITGASVYVFFQPSWGAAVFVVSAIALAIACVLVLGASVYILTRIWIDTLKERKRRKKEVKQ
jgi:3D (Asp-Asp-Asp) domain-containing protein